MPLPSLLLIIGVLLVGAPPVHAQHEPLPDTLAAPAEAPRPLPSVTGPTRRCRDETVRPAGAPPLAQARCSGGFGLPAVASDRRVARVDAGLHARVRAVLAAALAERRTIE